jgi:hypothetical protein
VRQGDIDEGHHRRGGFDAFRTVMEARGWILGDAAGPAFDISPLKDLEPYAGPEEESEQFWRADAVRMLRKSDPEAAEELHRILLSELTRRQKPPYLRRLRKRS